MGSLFPIFVKLADRFVVVVGGGLIAEGKIPALLAAGARVRVIAPEATQTIAQWSAQAKLDWRQKSFDPSDLEGAHLVIAATSAPGVNESVFREAEARNILCNAVDDIQHCHFYYGSILQRGDLQIAISTNGKSPALAQRLRQELEKQFGPEYEAWLKWLGSARDRLRATNRDAESKREILHELASHPAFERFVQDSRRELGLPEAARLATPQQGTALPGKVYLVGAGPGDPDFLTVKAVHLLDRATVVLHDSLVSREVLQLISPRAEVIDVGKRAGQKLLTQNEINSMLVSLAASHETVIRLKGGDPLLFGRAAEEIGALRQAGIAFEIVPGITAAFGAAASAGISLTDRRAASQVVITTFSRGTQGGAMDWGAITTATTLVLYMPGPGYAEVAERLREGGLPPDLPCVIISNATAATQQLRWTTVAGLATEERLPAPALLIVGRVAAKRIHEITETFWTDEFRDRLNARTSVS